MPQLSENRIILLLIIALCILILIPILIASFSLSAGDRTCDETEEKISFGGKCIRVYVEKEKKVVTMDLEEYIICVVSAEMPVSYELEALKAQACAARTFAVSRMMQNGGCSKASGAQVCTSSNHCQAYISVEDMKKNWGSDYEIKCNKIKKAVSETKGQIITYQNKPISALYHSTSGGYTENSEDVFVTAKPYLRSVISEGEEPYAPRFYGQVKVSYKDFISKLKAFDKDIQITEENIETKIMDIKRTNTNRVEQLKIDDKAITGREFRGLFGLNSTNFKINFENKHVVFNTIGFGHGVGMSQTGANAMAKKGAKYGEILKHYYTGVSIVSIANE